MRARIAAYFLLAAAAFGQSKTPGPGGSQPGPPSAAGSANNSRDVGSDHPLEMKSIDQVLHDDAKLSAKLQDMLPADLSPQQACAGFKTLEQCVTAIHLAQNLKLSFADLKAKTTGKGSVGFQKAIEQMAANANAKDELKKARKQAADDMKGTNLFGRLSRQEQMVPLSKPIKGVSHFESESNDLLISCKRTFTHEQSGPCSFISADV